MNHRHNRSSIGPASKRGFSLLELMVALALGLLLSAGILTLFSNTSQTNKVQEGLARLQEDGRFAISRMEVDMRAVGGQYCSNTSGKAAVGTTVPLLPVRAPQVWAPSLAWPDSGNMNSVNPATGAPLTSAAPIAYALSSRWFIQGYACTTPGSCTPAVPTTDAVPIPSEGLVAGRRLPASDVLTVRYQSGSGWPLPPDQCTHAGAPAKPDDVLAGGDTFTVSPQQGDNPVTSMRAALISDCANSNIIPIGSVLGNNFTIAPGILVGAPGNICTGSGLRDVRVFDFTNGFKTVTYYVALRADTNPDSRPNSAAAQRLIPTLVRRENGSDQDLVQGVDQLKFLYGVQDSLGNTRFMTADAISAAPASTCPPVADGLVPEPGCLWRAVRTIEAHLLVNSVDEVFGLDATSLSYLYMNTTTSTTQTGALPSGLTAGTMLRREFIAYLSNRNYNF
jgi:type IV pilus assembly protein PilW